MIDELVRAASQSDWERARQLLHAHWQDQCPKLFSPNQDAPWDISYDECAINSLLFRPLAAAYVQNPQTPSPSLLPLNDEAGTNPEDRRPGQICGHVFKTGEPNYSCRECATDPTCVLCHKCFTQSIHAQHKYRMSTSGGSGYCDCGDADAWRTGYVCNLHAISEEKKEACTSVFLPTQLHERVRGLTTILLQYSTKMVCFQEGDVAPDFILNPPELTPPYQTVLFNDETHTYDMVIRALDMAIHCSKNQAMLLATIVDREGRSSVKAGMKGECDRVKQDIQRRTSRGDANRRTERSGPLEVKVMESALVAHQAHAIQVIAWLNQQTAHFPALSEIIGEVLLRVEAWNSNSEMEVDGQEVETLLVKMMRSDRKLWKAARNNFHQLLMKTVLMHMDHKLEFSKQFLKHYEEMYSEFVDDDHDHDMSIVTLTVQFLTVPSIAKRLIAEEDAISVVFKALGKHTDQYLQEPKNVTSRFDFAQRSFPATLKRAMHMMRDQCYMLNVVPGPGEWTTSLRDHFISGCKEFIRFLHHMQGMDEVKRQSVEHQVWELEWETAFNMQLRIQEIITMMLAWAAADKQVHHRLLAICLEACTLHKPPVLEPCDANGATHLIVEVNGESVAVGCFDVLKGAVSIHQPIYRLLAGLFAVERSFLYFLEPDVVPTEWEEIQLRKEIKDMGQNLYEMSLRVLVLCAQSHAGLWRRNGFSLVNQIHNYFSPLCRNEMMDRDLLLVQVGAALSKPTHFLLHFMHRYRVSQWADSNFDGHTRSATPYGNKIEPEESSKITVNLAEDMLHMLIIICGERYVPGVGVCSKIEQLNREVLHILCMGPQPFSLINKRISQDPMLKQLSLDVAVKNVGEFRKPTVTSAGTFYLKEELRSQYNPFFYHFSKADLSQAEQFQQKARVKEDRSLIACPPPVPVPFTPFFAPIRQLLRSPTLIRVHRVVLERVAKRSRFSSDRLLHRTLYLIGMALHEQALELKEFDFVTEAEDENILSLMEALSGKAESQGHSDLLWWTIQKFKEIQRLASSNGQEDEEKSGESVQKEENADDAKKRRLAMAAKMRTQALKKMQKMQTKFLHQIKQDSTEREEIVESGEPGVLPRTIVRMDEDEDAVGKLIDDGGFPVCLGPNKAKVETVLPRSVTCILCQEEETLDVNSKPFVCAAFVQKSHLFAQRSPSASVRLDIHLVNASLEVGIDASTCSHTMHYLCYQNLSESLLNRERNRPRQQMVYNQRMVDTENGEYLCPLCKRLSNTAMPLIPAMQKLGISGFSHNRPAANEDFDEWVDRLRELVNTPPQAIQPKPAFKSHSRKRSHSERALNDLVKQSEKDQLSNGTLENALSSSVPSASAMDLLLEGDSSNSTAGPPERTLSQTNQLRAEMETNEHEARNAADFLNNLLRDREQTQSPVSSPSASDDLVRRAATTSGRRSVFAFPNNVIQMIMKMPSTVISKFSKKVVSLEKYDEMVRGFTKFVIKSRSTDEKELNDEVRGVMSAMGIWQSCAHVTRAVAVVLKNENKPLFGALNTRQRDCILAMARLSALLSYNLQPFAEIICQMLRVLLASTPENFVSVRSSSEGLQSPTYPTSPPPSDQATPTTNKLLTSPIAQFFLPSTPQQRNKEQKEHNINLLNVDMLSLALELMMCIGWTWHDGAQSVRGFKNATLRDLVPDGSLDELYVLRLALLGLYFQVFATFDDQVTDCEMRDNDDEENERRRVLDLWQKARRSSELKNVDGLLQKLRAATVDLLRPLALLYHAITLVPPPEALKDPYVDELEPLCRYMGLPTQMSELFEGVAIEKLFEMWSSSIHGDLFRSEFVSQPIHPNLLMDLPEDFSELINMAAKFRCPSIPLEEMTSSIPTMCLVCGKVLCSQSYCCQKQIGKDIIGACQYHMQQCSGPSGVFIRMREAQIVMMTSRNRGCMKAAPYVDEFGEADVGFRRGNPLKLNQEQYAKIRQLWLHQGIAEEVVNQFEIDHRNVGQEWDHF